MNTPQEKICSKCHISQPFNAYVNDTSHKDGKASSCRTCENLRGIAYHKANREKRRLYAVTYRAAHKEELREKAAIYDATHKAETHAYYLAHKPEILARVAAYAAEHPAEVNGYKTKWAQAHPEVHAEKEKRRRAAKANAPVNNLTHAQWVEIQASQAHRCYYCHKRRKGKLTRDHVDALATGGSHTVPNIIAACRQCNSRKGKRKPPIPVQLNLLTAAPPKAFKPRGPRKPKAA